MRSRAPRRRPGSSIGQEPVVKVQRVARMGIDAQRSGASELPVRAVKVRRGRTAYPLPSGCPGTPWYARREFWAGQLAEKGHSSAQHDEGDPGVDRPERGSASERSRATPVSPAFWALQPLPNDRWQSPAFWAVQPSANGRWQSPARPMRLSVRYEPTRFAPA